jgi:tetratricopeptide (TPR) repeat protein
LFRPSLRSILRVVRRYGVLGVVLGLAAVAGASIYLSYATERDYAQLIAAGDRAAAADEAFQALESYSGAVALRPDSMLAYLKRGRTYKDRGDLDAAARDLRHAAELDPTATLPLELLGDTFLALDRPERAAERFQTYLTLDDRSAAVWYKLGLSLYRSGQIGRGIPALERAVALDTSMAEGFLVLGLALRDDGQSAKARTALERAARLAPALPAPREALADLYAAIGEHTRAIDQLEALAALDPTTPARFVALGRAHARARRHEAAVLALSRAVERFPDDPHVYGALGRVWLDVAEIRDDPISLRKALEALTTAASHAEATSTTLTDLGRAWMIAGDSSAAERAFRDATSRRPVEADAYLRLARVVGPTRTQEARDALVRYAALVGDAKPLASVATDIAAYSVRIGEPQFALKWIDRAVEESGETPLLARLRSQAAAAMAH